MYFHRFIEADEADSVFTIRPDGFGLRRVTAFGPGVWAGRKINRGRRHTAQQSATRRHIFEPPAQNEATGARPTNQREGLRIPQWERGQVVTAGSRSDGA